jgi:transposase-like protein
MKISKEEKAQLLEDWQRSGKKAWTYAREKGLIPRTFVGWVQRARKKETGFVEVSAQAVAGLRSSQELLIEVGGMNIHVPVALRMEELQRVLKAIGGVQ